MEINIAPPVLDIDTSAASHVYFTSDWHLNHENIFYFTDRNKLLSHEKYTFFKAKPLKGYNTSMVFGKTYTVENGTYQAGEIMCIGMSPIDGRPMFMSIAVNGLVSTEIQLFDSEIDEHILITNVKLIDGTSHKENIRCNIIEYNHILIDRMNSVLTEDDLLVNCGDLMLSHISELSYYLNKVKCKQMVCVLGNHDYANFLKKPNHSLIRNTSSHISFTNMLVLRINKGKHLLHMLSVSHMPLYQYIGKGNIHGHLHSTPNLDDFKKSSDYEVAVKCRDDGKHFDCGVDRNGYMPVSLKDILENKTDLKI